ncbi:hypothetical protein EV368DRAFT_67767 [Lentinula lateritia]|nr:hypothetical protein EV368DRAFT_67767 [Lentinula lateritia]
MELPVGYTTRHRRTWTCECSTSYQVVRNPMHSTHFLSLFPQLDGVHNEISFTDRDGCWPFEVFPCETLGRREALVAVKRALTLLRTLDWDSETDPQIPALTSLHHIRYAEVSVFVEETIVVIRISFWVSIASIVPISQAICLFLMQSCPSSHLCTQHQIETRLELIPYDSETQSLKDRTSYFDKYSSAGCILGITHIHALPHPGPPDTPDWVLQNVNALSPPFPSVDRTVFDSPLAQPKPMVSDSVNLTWAKVRCVFDYNSNKDREGKEVEEGEMVLITLNYRCKRPGAVNVLNYTKQLVDVGYTSNKVAAMIIRGRIGWPMEEELKKRNAKHREKEVWDAVCDKVVYFATEYQVLYVGLNLSFHVLVNIRNPNKKPEITLLGWHQHFLIKKGIPEDKIREYCHAQIQWLNYSSIAQWPYN